MNATQLYRKYNGENSVERHCDVTVFFDKHAFNIHE